MRVRPRVPRRGLEAAPEGGLGEQDQSAARQDERRLVRLAGRGREDHSLVPVVFLDLRGNVEGSRERHPGAAAFAALLRRPLHPLGIEEIGSGDLPAASRARIEAAILAEIVDQPAGSCRSAGGEEEAEDAGGGLSDV